MSIEKYDKKLKDKIDGLNEIPLSFSFNPSVSWQQLENKIQPSVKKKKAIWFYWVAATVLIVCSAFLLLSQNKKSQSNSTLVIKSQGIKKQELVIVETKNNLPNTVRHEVQKVTVQSKNKPIQILAVTDSQPVLLKVEPALNYSASSQNPLIKNAVTTQSNNTLNSNSISIVKVKRRIIHLNELGDEEQQPAILVKAENKKNTQQETENTTTEINSKGWWLFKSKTASANTSITDNQ